MDESEAAMHVALLLATVSRLASADPATVKPGTAWAIVFVRMTELGGHREARRLLAFKISLKDRADEWLNNQIRSAKELAA